MLKRSVPLSLALVANSLHQQQQVFELGNEIEKTKAIISKQEEDIESEQIVVEDLYEKWEDLSAVLSTETTNASNIENENQRINQVSERNKNAPRAVGCVS